MRVLVLGAYGLIGQEIVRELLRRGHDVSGLGRDERVAKVIFPKLRWHFVDIGRVQTEDNWQTSITDIDVVINASGALQSGGKDNVKAVQTDAILALIKACNGIKQFVQISATGANADANTEFMRTKSVADNALKESGVPHIILRPGLVLSPVPHGGTVLLRMLAAMPMGLFLTMADRKVQTVSVYDVARVSADAAEGKFPNGTDVGLAADTPHSLEDIVRAYRNWLGMPKPKFVVRAPKFIAYAIGKGADALGHLGWRSPLRTTALTVMDTDVLSDTSRWKTLGEPLKSLEETLADIPCRLQDRWHANMALLFPVMIGILSVFWVISSMVGFLRLDEAVSVLTGSAIPKTLHAPFVIGGGIVDIVLGFLILIRKYVGIATVGMIAVTIAYLGMATIFTPALWGDPLGALVKTIPAMALAAVVYMLKDAR